MLLQNDHEISQNKILSLIKQGKEVGMKQLFDCFFDELFRYCYKQIGNKEDSEDILQTVFTDLWQNCNNREISNLKAYLYQMIKYRIYKYWINKKDITELVEEFNDILSTYDVSQTLEAKELEDVLSVAVNKLPNACKEVFKLSRYEELSLNEIANKLDISKQTVKNQLTKATSIIKTTMLLR